MWDGRTHGFLYCSAVSVEYQGPGMAPVMLLNGSLYHSGMGGQEFQDVSPVMSY